MIYYLNKLVLCFLVFEKMAAANFTFDWRMASHCKEHVCTRGYAYDKFYEVFEGDGVHNNNDSAFEMHLAILASSNGHILLSHTSAPEPNEEVYEIVVGGGGNKFTELRRNLRRNAKASAKTMGILSAIEFRAFYIRISENGYIEFGREGDPLPVLSYNDVNPINVKFFSFAAWNGVEAKFLYDCPSPSPSANNTDKKVPDSKMVEPKLSTSDALKRTLLMDRSAVFPPERTIDVGICYKITSVQYDTRSTKLTTSMAIVAGWTDRRLSWNPDKFNGTKVLKFRQGEIWNPSFFVFNANDRGLLVNKNTELITMTKNGEATLHFQTTLTTWCFDEERPDTRNRWPNDGFDCMVMIGAYQPHERFVLYELDVNKLKVFADIDEIVKSDWTVKPYSAIVNISTVKSVIALDNETHQSDRLIIGLELHRRATAFNIVFYTPLLVLVTFVLLSFLNESLQMSRVWFYSGCCVAVSAGFCFVDYLVPCPMVPGILILYATTLIGVLVALLVQVILMMPVVDRLCKTVFLQSLIMSKWFRTLFFLPALKTCRNYDSINEAYASQEDDDSGVIVAPRNGNVEEMEAEASKYGEKQELAEALDKLMFFVYSLTFAVMLAVYC